MGVHSGVGAAHPHFVSIPDPKKVEGLRAYREPEVPHPLQITFLEESGERAFIEELRTLLVDGRAAEADARISAELEHFDGSLARLCKSLPTDIVALEGWDDLLPILSEWEGPVISAITIGLTNPADLVFEAGKSHEPELLISLYSDDTYEFSRASKADLLSECAKESPAWTDADEDVEFYCELSGLADLNTALINCKHRRFLRDGRDGVEGRAPGGYVEYVLGCWLLATRFLQAVERDASKALPKGCRLIVGTVEINADFVTVLGDDRPSTLKKSRANKAPEPEFATLSVKPWVPREDPTAEPPSEGPVLRHRLRPAETIAAEEPRRSFLARLFGRLRRR